MVAKAYRTGLPRGVYVLQAGLVLNAFGNGAANPFLVIYLHDVRAIPLGLAGLAGSTSAVCALGAALVAGSIADRRGARPTMTGGLLVSTAAFALYPLIREPWHAFALAFLTGSGIGTWLTMQSSLLAAITPRDRRAAAFAQQRVAANIGLGLGGFAGGPIVTTAEPKTFTLLFLLNAATFAVYIGFLLRLRVPTQDPVVRSEPGGYGVVLRDRAFVRLAILNFAFVAGTISLVVSLFPVFAKNEADVDEDLIGLLFLVNSLLIIAAQLPVARAIEGHRRMAGFALMALMFAICWGLALAGGVTASPTLATALFAAGFAVLSIGECLYDAIHGPLVADLAPPHLAGRYMAANGFTWQLGFIAGPGVGGVVLGAEPFALWPIAIAVCLAAGMYALRIEHVVPADRRLTPRRA